MAEECTDQSSVATSTPINWWDLHHASSNNFSSWHHHHKQNPNSNNSSCEEDVSISTASFTNASNHSGLTMGGVIRSTVGNSVELNNSHDSGHNNLLDALSSKSGIFDQPACDYLKKMDNSNWEFTSSFNNFEKHNLNGFNTDHDHHHQQNLLIPNGIDRLSKLVNNWSIAPPDQEINQLFDPKPFNISLDCSVGRHDQYLSQPGASTLCQMQQKQILDPLMGRNSAGLFHDLKMESDHHQEIERSRNLIQRSFDALDEYQVGLNSPMVGDNTKLLHGMPYSPCTRKFNDVLNFTSRFTKPLLDINVSKPCLKPLSLSDCKKQASSTRINGRGQGSSNEGKKKRSEEASETTATKKAKQENSTASSVKAPKVKLTDRITTLQQIVSPFGKTDTASVLYEAIRYIKFLQEQVQLLSNPYLKTNSHKDPWGSLERKDNRGDHIRLDLRSRGLCLVPISSTPQDYRENNGSDYWSPTFSGCLYR
ncbi:transcription factor bHLH111-like [Rutidosis leptorrhynchoides]|uniref:transcription factor bHLH111-like n=1 Tax=Rutidosis leptorrhynchoides TaxID=125765 RepID=UPI003A99578C